jgi:RES domain-containing protein
MIEAWRLVKTKDAPRAFTGMGKGRWSSDDVHVVYLAGSQSLAVLELLVHFEKGQSLRGYSMISVRFDPRLVGTVRASSLPEGWDAARAPAELRRKGDDWARGCRSLVLSVPSAVVPAERVYLLNADHPSFARARIGPARPFAIDVRLNPLRHRR